jgi:hypothetical protein
MHARVLWVVGTLFVLAVLVFAALHFYFSGGWGIFGGEAGPSGRITFSVAKFPIDASLPGGVMTLTADLAKKSYGVPKADPAGTLEYQYRMVATTSRPWVVFVRAKGVTKNVGDIATVPFEIYRANLHNVPWSQLDTKIDSAEQVTNNPGTTKLFPEISSNGDVLYMGRSITATNATKVDDWNIHLVANGGNDSILSTGMYPKWVNNDQFVFLKNDGLYLYTISSKKFSRVLGADSQLSNNNTLYVSDDGKYVAWSIPEKRTLLVIEAQDWATGKFTLKGSVPLIGWYPVISPDNHFLAVLTEVKATPKWFPIISFIDLNTLKVLKSSTFSLDNVYKDTRPLVNLGEVVPDGVNFNYIVLNNWLQPTNAQLQ